MNGSPSRRWSRRQALRAGVGFACAAAAGSAGVLASCGRRAGERAGRGGRVVVYSSLDQPILAPLLARFENDSGLRVDLVGDTEATKTTGLVQRLLSEAERPRADVWWSSEPLGTIRLADAGVLDAYTSPGAEARARAAGLPGWPASRRGEGARWYAHAARCRVLVHRRDARHEGSPGGAPAPDGADATAGSGWPRSLGALASGRARVAVARPGFGTTRTHMGALMAAHGEAAFAAWCDALRGRVTLVDGNSAVVRAVAQGQADLGLTDSDDVYAGQANGWPIGLSLIGNDLKTEPSPPEAAPTDVAFPRGPLVIPCTVALVRGGPNPAGGAGLIDFILSARVDAALARGPWRTWPTFADVSSLVDGADVASLAGIVDAGGSIESAERAPLAHDLTGVDLPAAARLAARAAEVAERAWA